MAKFQKDVSMYNDYYDSEREEAARKDLFNEYGEEEGWESPEDVPDERVSDYINDNNDVASRDLNSEMDEFFKEYEKFIISGEIGLWNGRRSGADVIVNKDDLWKYFKDCDYFNFYEDENGDLCIECSHHDGDNFFVVRPISKRGYEELERMEVDLDYDGLDLGDDSITDWLDDPANFEHGYFHKRYGFTESHKPSGKTLKESAGLNNEWVAPSVSELAEGLKDGVNELWETREDGGCIHWPVYTDDNGTEFDIVLGWESGYEDNPDYYFDEGYAICYAIMCQDENNAMQTDMEMDFEYPYDEESGETLDWGGSISRNQDYNKLAKELLKAAKAIVRDCAQDED